MKTLILVRHAKSSWGHAGLDDRDRPLKPKGVRDAHQTASDLVQRGAVPDGIVTSPAARALHTAVLMARALDVPLENVRLDERVYESNSQNLVEAAASAPGAWETLLLVGHEPSLSELLERLCPAATGGFPTAGAAGLALPASRSVRGAGGKCTLKFFYRPDGG